MDNTEEKFHKPYRIMEGDTITVIRQDAESKKDGNHYTFYKVATKNSKDDEQTYYKSLKFPSGTDIADGTKIKINNMIEYARHLDRFNDAYYLYIKDYEVIAENASNAIEEYKKELDNNEEDTIW